MSVRVSDWNITWPGFESNREIMDREALSLDYGDRFFITNDMVARLATNWGKLLTFENCRVVLECKQDPSLNTHIDASWEELKSLADTEGHLFAHDEGRCVFLLSENVQRMMSESGSKHQKAKKKKKKNKKSKC